MRCPSRRPRWSSLRSLPAPWLKKRRPPRNVECSRRRDIWSRPHRRRPARGSASVFRRSRHIPTSCRSSPCTGRRRRSRARSRARARPRVPFRRSWSHRTPRMHARAGWQDRGSTGAPSTRWTRSPTVPPGILTTSRLGAEPRHVRAANDRVRVDAAPVGGEPRLAGLHTRTDDGVATRRETLDRVEPGDAGTRGGAQHRLTATRSAAAAVNRTDIDSPPTMERRHASKGGAALK